MTAGATTSAELRPGVVGFLRDNARWLAAGMLLAFASSFGQTFFIALFANDLRAELGLSHSGWGTLYAVATLAAAASLAQLGRLADIRSPRWLAVRVLLVLGVFAVTMAAVGSVWMLALAVFGLRLAGQGLLSHVSMTMTARGFAANRGRAIGIVSLGYPLGEAILPVLTVAAILAFGWRDAWLGVALVVLLVIAPLAFVLLANPRQPRSTPTAAVAVGAPGLQGRHWQRAEVVRHPLFWALVPGLLAPPLIGTSILFQGMHLVAAKGWAPDLYALAFPAYAAASVAASLGSGFLVDRFGAARLLPFYQIPLALGLVLAATLTDPASAFLYLGLIGLTTGAGFTIVTALWAELYGTDHLGAVRGLTSSLLIFATALGPGLTGTLLDVGVGIERQFAAMATVTLLFCGSFAVTVRGLRRQPR
ncbi:MAG: MFS transporter [Pseudomonadota bacterium]